MHFKNASSILRVFILRPMNQSAKKRLFKVDLSLKVDVQISSGIVFLMNNGIPEDPVFSTPY